MPRRVVCSATSLVIPQRLADGVAAKKPEALDLMKRVEALCKELHKFVLHEGEVPCTLMYMEVADHARRCM